MFDDDDVTPDEFEYEPPDLIYDKIAESEKEIFDEASIATEKQDYEAVLKLFMWKNDKLERDLTTANGLVLVLGGILIVICFVEIWRLISVTGNL